MKFSDIPGHDSVKRRLIEMVDNDRLPHALVLQGKPGIGKFMLARALAQYIHCSNRHNGDSCGECPSCVQHQSFNHIDTIFAFPVLKPKGTSDASKVTGDYYSDEWREFLTDSPYMDFQRWQSALGNINGQPIYYVGQSDELSHKLSFTSHGSTYKVALLWLPEKMNEQSANKLLKLIEEPFPDTKIIMVSNKPEEILPTIYSRVQRIDVKRLPDEILAEVIAEEGMSADDAMAVAHLAEGSVIEALRQLQLTGDQKRYLELFKQLMRLAYTRDVKGLREWSVAVADLGREQSVHFIEYCQRLVRENFIYNIREPQLNYLNSHEAEFSVKFARFINERNVIAMTNALDEAIRDIQGNGNAKIVFFDLAITMIILIKS